MIPRLGKTAASTSPVPRVPLGFWPHALLRSRLFRRTGPLLLVLPISCSASNQKPAVEAAMKNDEMRTETFEATLRTLDEHPEYVDQFFQQALKHPSTLDRFLQNTAKGLEDESLARMTAQRLSEQPGGLKQVMLTTFDAISNKPASLQAVAESMRERPQIAALVMVQREDAMRATMRALIKEVGKNADGRRAFLISVQENSYPMAALILQDQKVTLSMLEAFGKVGMKKGKKELEELVKVQSAKDEK